MPPLRLSPLPPDLALRLTPSSTRALLARFAPGSCLSIDPSDRYSVAEALSFRHVAAPLAAALANVARLSTPVGHEAILEVLAALSLSTPRLLEASPENLAARIVCARGLTKRQARAVLKRALIRVSRHFAPRAWYTLLWPRRELPSRAELLLDAARVVHGARFVRGWIARDESEPDVVRALVVYRGLPQRDVTDTGGASRARTVRPLACDVVRWDARDGRISFSLGRPALLADWATAIGQACANEPRAFADQPAYTHKSLHEKGAAWLARVPLPPGVTRLEVISCEVDDGKRLRVRSDGALAAVHEAGGRARGYLRSVTLRFEVAGHDEPIDATIELPWKVHLSDARFEEPLRLVMEALGMHAPGTLADDLPSLAPMQPEWRWVDLIALAGFARALGDKTLVRVRGKRPSGREHRRWGSLLRAFDVPGEEAAYVVGEEMAIRAFDAKPEALVWYAIDWARVGSVLRARLGLAETRVSDVPDEVVAIGEMGEEARRVVVFTVARVVAEDEVVRVLKALRHACGRATPALVVPRGRSLGGAVAEVEVSPGEQLGVEDVAWVAGKIAQECGVGDDVEPGNFATKEAPLVLSVARGEAWYGRVRLMLTENQLAMLFALAKAKGWMKAVELGKRIAPTAEIPDQVVRKARLSLVARIEESFKAAGVKMPKGVAEGMVIVSRSKGYRLGMGVIVR